MTAKKWIVFADISTGSPSTWVITTVVMELVDLETGCVVASASLENPQRFGGSDVIMNRIS